VKHAVLDEKFDHEVIVMTMAALSNGFRRLWAKSSTRNNVSAAKLAIVFSISIQ